jgi:magnesium chelatase family protein
LAKRLPTIMPPMSREEILETSKIYSISGKLTSTSLIIDRPFRSPHHTTSQAGLVGGGSFPQPGEISLAQHGILFLDEWTDFRRSTLEVLRQPLESKAVCISRALHTLTFPASFLLVGALNPCPCGYFGDKKKRCSCSERQIKSYLEKLSGPLLDRIDLQITVPPIEYDAIVADVHENTSSCELYKKVEQAVERQKARFGQTCTWNSSMTTDMIDKYCSMTTQAQESLKKAFERLGLSMRGYHKLLNIARTIADLEGSELIDGMHIREAMLYRSVDRSFERQSSSWGDLVLML